MMLLSEMIWLLFIDDPSNVIWNLPGLAAILLIQNQFKPIYVLSDNFQCASW